MAMGAHKKKNAADAATRNLWIRGPKFLESDEKHWPQQPTLKHDTLEERKTICCVVLEQKLFEVDRFSCFLRLKMAIGWVLRFFGKIRKKSTESSRKLTAEELVNAELFLVRSAQKQSYG